MRVIRSLIGCIRAASAGRVARRRRLLLALALPAFCLAVLPAAASAAPLVTATSATGISANEATLRADVNPLGSPATYYFQYGTTTAYGSKTAEASAGSGWTSVETPAKATGLAAGTTYHFRIVVSNWEGTTLGADKTFTTTSPGALTESPTEVFAREARLNGTVEPGGLKTFYYFEYGTSEAYGSKTPEVATAELRKASAVVRSLSPGTTYHYRLVATNSQGTTKGADKTVTTLTHGWYLEAMPYPEKVFNPRYESLSCLSGSECVAVGWDGSETPMAASWNGSKWSSMTVPKVGTSHNGLIAVSCSSLSACTAVGSSASYPSPDTLLVERWNGTEWKIQEAPAPAGAVRSILQGVSCTSATACIAVGFYDDAEGRRYPFGEIWNGTEWKLQAMPSPEGKTNNLMYDISCTSSTACTAVGISSSRILVERWNGTEWKIQTTPEVIGTLRGVSCTSSTACVAVGDLLFEDEAYAASWNGTEWKSINALHPAGTTASWLHSVSCTSSSACTAVGGYEPEGGGVVRALAEGWNGSGWEIQPVPKPSEEASGGNIKDVACPSSSLCQAVTLFSTGPFAARFE